MVQQQHHAPHAPQNRKTIACCLISYLTNLHMRMHTFIHIVIKRWPWEGDWYQAWDTIVLTSDPTIPLGTASGLSSVWSIAQHGCRWFVVYSINPCDRIESNRIESNRIQSYPHLVGLLIDLRTSEHNMQIHRQERSIDVALRLISTHTHPEVVERACSLICNLCSACTQLSLSTS